MKNNYSFYLIFCFIIIYLSVFFVNSARSEYLLVKKDLMFLGRSVKGENLVTCYNKLIPIGSGQLFKVTTKCPNGGGTWSRPIAFNIDVLLNESFNLLKTGEDNDAQKMLEFILKKDPGNPLALNNLAAIMVKQRKFDKAEAYLKQALPRAKDYKVQTARGYSAFGVSLAFKPVAGPTGNQDLGPLIKMNIQMVKGYMTISPQPKEGLQ
jgi:tetratricopeptide (TPR) repeat protein